MSCACAHDRNRRDQCHLVRKELRELPGLPARLELPEPQPPPGPRVLLGLIETRKLREAPVLQEIQVLLAFPAPPEVQLWPAPHLRPWKGPGSIAH